jgi:hypothetical protein
MRCRGWLNRSRVAIICYIVLLQTLAAVKTLARRLMSRDHLYLFRQAPMTGVGLAAFAARLGLTN